jgi:hypothetical protein
MLDASQIVPTAGLSIGDLNVAFRFLNSIKSGYAKLLRT